MDERRLMFLDPLDEFHLISPPEHLRPPSSLHKNTIKALVAKRSHIKQAIGYNLQWDRQRNQNTCWPPTSDLYICALHVLLLATESRALN